MSTTAQQSLTRLGVTLGVALSIFSAVQAFANIPYRLDQVEQRMRAVEREAAINRDILVRIEERVKWLQDRNR